MSLRRYVATGRGGSRAIAAVLGASLAAGIAVGIAEGLLDAWFSLLVLFPLLIGLAAGGLASWGVARFQLRAPVLALLLGAAGGGAGYVATHAVNYLQLRSIVEDAMRDSNPAGADLHAAFDEALREKTGASGFRGYLALSAEQGVSIKRMGTSDKGIGLTGTGAWIMWLCELLIAAATAAFIAFGRAREPFCEGCEQWFGPALHVAAGGDGSKPARRELIAALDAGDVVRGAQVFATPPSAKGGFALLASSCPRCQIDAHCTLKQVVTAKRGQPRVTKLESWLMASTELKQLGDAIGRAQGKPGSA
jgi:hypothetical protein